MIRYSKVFNYEGKLIARCPFCGEEIEVGDMEPIDNLDGTDVYDIICPNKNCKCHFLANEKYE